MSVDKSGMVGCEFTFVALPFDFSSRSVGTRCSASINVETIRLMGLEEPTWSIVSSVVLFSQHEFNGEQSHLQKHKYCRISKKVR